MLFLLFQLGEERYALEASHVVAVLPRLDVKPIPHAPPPVIGLCRYRDVTVPVIDVTELALCRPSANRLSSRIVVVNFPDPIRGPHLLGLLAEKVTHTIRREPIDFAPSGVTVDGAPYLGPVIADSRGLIQRIEVHELLPESLRALLFNEAVAA